MENFGGAARRQPMVAGMEDDGFFAPVTRCERCGGDYQLIVVPALRGPVSVDLCPACDLGAIPLSK